MVEDCIALYDKWIMEKDEETAKTKQTKKIKRNDMTFERISF